MERSSGDDEEARASEHNKKSEADEPRARFMGNSSIGELAARL
jgi:hypothetical protein